MTGEFPPAYDSLLVPQSALFSTMNVATYAAAQLLRVLPRARITRAVGRLVDAEPHPAILSTVVALYSRAYQVDLDEAEPQPGGFPSFDAFFTRALRDGARPTDAPDDAFVSPADGRVEAIGPVERDGRILVKGKPYTCADLVGDTDDARRYEGGQFAVVYLSPRDYHRVHTPVAGVVRTIRSMEGDYYPVNAIGERHIRGLFARNRRVAIPIDTEAHGRVTVVMVSAMIVGRVSVTGIDARDVPIGLHTLSPELTLRRGDEIGIFHLGSTAVVFVEPGAWPSFTLPPGKVRVGETFCPNGAR
ncbi:MAG: archaetidylserine decarboxylase [Polyangiaceae bacterium]